MRIIEYLLHLAIITISKSYYASIYGFRFRVPTSTFRRFVVLLFNAGVNTKACPGYFTFDYYTHHKTDAT